MRWTRHSWRPPLWPPFDLSPRPPVLIVRSCLLSSGKKSEKAREIRAATVRATLIFGPMWFKTINVGLGDKPFQKHHFTWDELLRGIRLLTQPHLICSSRLHYGRTGLSITMARSQFVHRVLARPRLTFIISRSSSLPRLYCLDWLRQHRDPNNTGVRILPAPSISKIKKKIQGL